MANRSYNRVETLLDGQTAAGNDVEQKIASVENGFGVVEDELDVHTRQVGDHETRVATLETLVTGDVDYGAIVVVAADDVDYGGLT